MLNESITLLVEQAVEELSIVQITFGFKLMIIFGFFYLINVLAKTGGSLINFSIYVYAFIKWVVFKLRNKDI